MRDKLIEAARKKFEDLEREVDAAIAKGESINAITEKQRKLIAHGNYLRKLERQ